VTKFVGKFRKNQDYNEDYEYTKNVLHNKKRNNEHPEVKKLKVQERKNFDLFDEYSEND
jgi:hypothetical protein